MPGDVSPASDAKKFVKSYIQFDQNRTTRINPYQFAEDFLKLSDAAQKAVLNDPDCDRFALSDALARVARLRETPLSDKAKQLIQYREEPQFKNFTVEDVYRHQGKKNEYYTHQTEGFSYVLLGSYYGEKSPRIFC